MRLTTDQIVERLRALVGVHRPNAFTTSGETLVDAVVHGLDVAIPLGIDLPLADRCSTAVLDLLAGYQDTGKTAVFQHTVVHDRRLVATDVDWSWGSGPVTTADSTTLILLMSGRSQPAH